MTDPVGLVRKAQRLFKGDRDYDLVYVSAMATRNIWLLHGIWPLSPLAKPAGAITQVQLIAKLPEH